MRCCSEWTHALGCLSSGCGSKRSTKPWTASSPPLAAHAAFDPLWRAKMARDSCTKSQARKAGYRWLAEQLGMPYKKTHIGDFDLAECQRVVEVCNMVNAARAEALKEIQE